MTSLSTATAAPLTSGPWSVKESLEKKPLRQWLQKRPEKAAKAMVQESFGRIRPGGVVLHIWVIRSSCTLGHNPSDVLRRILDVTGFTVHAVLRVDLETRAITLFNNFVYPSRAIALGWLGIHGQVVPNWHVGVFQCQVTGLILFVIGVG